MCLLKLKKSMRINFLKTKLHSKTQVFIYRKLYLMTFFNITLHDKFITLFIYVVSRVHGANVHISIFHAQLFDSQDRSMFDRFRRHGLTTASGPLVPRVGQAETLAAQIDGIIDVGVVLGRTYDDIRRRNV